MAPARNSVREVLRRRVAPPPASVASPTLPLSYFDVLWLGAPAVQRLIFYQLPVSTHDFQTSHFPALVGSLSAALRIFFPLAGHLTTDNTGDPVIAYTDGDAVPVILAESDADFHHVAGNQLRDAEELHPFTPPLQEDGQGGKKPILALQVTVFPCAGVCIGYSLNHVAADGSSVAHFLRSWAEIMKSGGTVDPPLFDRGLVGDLEKQKRDHLDWLKKMEAKFVPEKPVVAAEPRRRGGAVRATCVLTGTDVQKLRDLVTACGRDVGQRPSTFAVACAYMWTCLVRARRVEEGEEVYLAIPADCRRRLRPPAPDTYFGNCISAAFAEASGAELTREGGVAAAVEAICHSVRRLEEEGAFPETRDWIPKMTASLAAGRLLSVAGSPRLRVYDTDFVWGPPKKTDIISIENNGAISLSESRERDGGVEIGLVGPTNLVGPLLKLLDAGLRGL